MASFNLRKDDELFRMDLENSQVVFRKAEPISYNRLVRVPTYKWMYERYHTVLNEIPSNKQGRKRQATLRVRKELVEVYLYCDLCPKSEKSIESMIEGRIKTLDRIRWMTVKDKAKMKSEEFLEDLSWGVDIQNKDRQEYLGITL